MGFLQVFVECHFSHQPFGSDLIGEPDHQDESEAETNQYCQAGFPDLFGRNTIKVEIRVIE